MKRIMLPVVLLGLVSLFSLSPHMVAGQTVPIAGEYVWKLVDIIDFDYAEYWKVPETEYWQLSASYSRGSYTAKIWHEDKDTHFVYGATARWDEPPIVLKAGEKVVLGAMLAETANTHKWNTSAASTWADFSPPERGPGQRGSIAFTTVEGLGDISINGAVNASTTASFSAVVPEGREGERLALRLGFYMGNLMSTYYVYEWQLTTVTVTTTPVPTSTLTPTTPLTTLPTTTNPVTATVFIDPDRIDSTVRFAGLSGQVEVRPGNDEDAWDFAKMGMVLYCEDHIKTGPRSSAIISFRELGTFVVGPNTEIVLATPPEKESKLELVIGNIWANIRQLAKDGTIEITMNQAVAGIKGTTFVCEATSMTSTIKVIEGSVEFRDISGKMILVNEGQKVSATSIGMGPIEVFDVSMEKQQWEGLIKTSPLNWGLIIGIIAALAASAVIVLFLFKKKR